MEWVSETWNGTIDYWSLKKFPAAKKKAQVEHLFAVSSLWGRSHQLSFSASQKTQVTASKHKNNPNRAGKEGRGIHKKNEPSHRNKAKCKEHITLLEKDFYEQFHLFIMLLILSTGQTALAGRLQSYIYVYIVFNLLLNGSPCLRGRGDCSLPLSAEFFSVY